MILVIVGLLIGLSKGGLGGPVPVALTAPLLSLTMPPAQAIGLVLPFLMFADLFALYVYWRKWDMFYIRLMLPVAVIGVIIGTTLLATLPDEVMRQVLGIFTLVAVAYKLASNTLKSVTYTPRNWHGYVAGGASGFGSALANVGAPPFTAYMLMQPDVTPKAFIGTTTLFFFVVNLLKLPGFIAADVLDIDTLLEVGWLVVVIPIGVWLGYTIVGRINHKVFDWLMTAALFLLGLSLLFT